MLTNEERRVYLYEGEEHPTIASTVQAETPLESLNLNWREKDLPERERTKHVHRLHPYLGKFIPQLVEIFLRKYFVPGQTVADPFCGSGTTMVQSKELGIHSIGYDVSEFNVMLCRAKTMRYDSEKAAREVYDVLEKTRLATRSSGCLPGLWDIDIELLETDSQYLKEWYAPQALQELLTYRSLIEKGGYTYTDLLKVILSRSSRSARLTTHFDLDFPKQPQTESYWCYKHSRNCQPTTEAFKFLERYSTDTIWRIKEYALVQTEATAAIIHGDSRTSNIPSVDGVITSPPYVGLIDYHKQHAYAYHLLGLEERGDLEIGAAANGSSQKAKRQYQQDIAAVFANILNSMPTGGRLIVVAGDRYNLYDGIADLIGVDLEAVILRHVNRRTGRRSTEFYESVFVWRKR
ncbi:MAG: class I SAM-dependent methyltransferase [Armatimonadetes bacterium]|nr:class I SAM-dependent methyltransferase [Armatimonadota bacterium]